MNILDIDFNSLLPYVIDAWTKVLGEEYRSLISKKLNKSLILPYYDVEGVSDYTYSLRTRKRRMFIVRLFEEMGINVEKYKAENYSKALPDKEISKVVDSLFTLESFAFSDSSDSHAPLRAFKPNNKLSPDVLLVNKLKVINYLRGDDKEEITENNFSEFAKTSEYLELLEKIDEYNAIYDRLQDEYNKWKKQLDFYDEFVKKERKRKDDILTVKTTEIFKKIFGELPNSVKNVICEKPLEEQVKIVFGSSDPSYRYLVEYFSEEQQNILKSPDSSYWDKYFIVTNQLLYLKNIGVNVPDDVDLKYKDDERINKCLSFLNQDDIKKYIPSEDTINSIIALKEEKYEEGLREYITTREDFIKIMGPFENNPSNIECIYNHIKNKRVCILGQGATSDDNEFVSIMLYTTRVNDFGLLFHIFVHECGHIIDQSLKGCGFESYNSFNEDSEKNPYDNYFRKYEKFNETLNDIFTIEAVKYLQNQGIFLIEPKEFTELDASNHNTAMITKKLLNPLLQKFRSQVIKAKVTADPEELIKYIGRDNFEDLVDAVNKVDYLSRNGVVPKIENNPNNAMVKEYYEQVERIGKIYINIDEYYASHFESSSNDENQISHKK